MSMFKKCNPNSKKIRIVSSCDRPVYTSLCNAEDITRPIVDAITDSNSALQQEIADASEAIETAITDVVATIDDGIDVNATQAGTWTIDTGSSIDAQDLADKIADALAGLNVTVDNIPTTYDVNVTNDAITVTVDNFPEATDYTTLLEEIRDKKDAEMAYTGRIVYDADGTPHSNLIEWTGIVTDKDGNATEVQKWVFDVSGDTVVPYTLTAGQYLDFPTDTNVANAVSNASVKDALTTDCNTNPALRVINECNTVCNTYTYTGTTNATVTGTDISITVENGTLTYNANTSGDVRLSTEDVHSNGINQVRSETLNGDVAITVTDGATYNVHYTSCSGQTLSAEDSTGGGATTTPTIDLQLNGSTSAGTSTGIAEGEVIDISVTYQINYSSDGDGGFVTITVPSTVQADGTFEIDNDAIISAVVSDDGQTDNVTIWSDDDGDYYTISKDSTTYANAVYSIDNYFNAQVISSTYPATATLASDSTIQDIDTSKGEKG